MAYDLSRFRTQLVTASVDLCAFRCGAVMRIPGDAVLATVTAQKLQDLLDRSAGVAHGDVRYVPATVRSGDGLEQNE